MFILPAISGSRLPEFRYSAEALPIGANPFQSTNDARQWLATVGD